MSRAGERSSTGRWPRTFRRRHDSGWSNWDVEIYGSRYVKVRLTTATEHHHNVGMLTRVRVQLPAGAPAEFRDALGDAPKNKEGLFLVAFTIFLFRIVTPLPLGFGFGGKIRSSPITAG